MKKQFETGNKWRRGALPFPYAQEAIGISPIRHGLIKSRHRCRLDRHRRRLLHLLRHRLGFR